MSTITSIKYSELANVVFATITFDNGAAAYCRCVRKRDDEVIILYANKLIAIQLPSNECEVLCEGVSIR